MVEQNASLDAVFRALADPTRRSMAEALIAKPLTVGELAEPHAMSLAGAAKHVDVLARAGLVRRERRGRSTVCTLAPEGLHAAYGYLETYADFWSRRLDALEAALLADDERSANEGDDE